MNSAAQEPFGRWGKGGLAGFLCFLVAFGCLVEARSALMQRRMGDLDVFLRAAWAVRAGADPYGVTSENDWHYIYPPLYAILLAPLADPPPGHDYPGYLPYAWSVAICYLINVFCLCFSAHVLASAIEERADDASFRAQPRFCRRWWALRLWPILICWLPIGHTMMRGQSGLIVLAGLCAALAGWLRGHNFRAGLWLAFAICIKVIPAYLLVYPLWKRDLRGLAGCTVGLLAGLIVIPVLVFGPSQTQTHYETYGKVFFAPLLKLNNDESRKEEILGVNATDSIGVKNALHNWIYPEPSKRPEDLSTGSKIAYLLLGFAMTLACLWPGTRKPTGALVERVHPFAGLILLMAIFSPVCHSHYLLFCLPVVMSLLAAEWQFQPTLRMSGLLWVSFAGFVLTMGVAYLPGLEILKDRCAALFATLPIWGIAVWQCVANASGAALARRGTHLPRRANVAPLAE